MLRQKVALGEALRAEGIEVNRVGILVLVDSLRNTANWDLASIEPSDPTRAKTSKIIHRVCHEMQSRYDVNTA